MPPRSMSSSDRSPLSVMRYSDDVSTCSSTMDAHGSKDRVPLNKSVRFVEERNKIFPITHLDDMEESEVASIWYDSNEYAEIKSSYQLTIFMMEAGEKLNGDEHTSRGLEYRTQEGAWARYENKRDAYNAVLDEQDRQWERDQDDHEAISRIYLEHSAKCAEAAAARALQDQKEAREILGSIIPKKKTKKSSSSSSKTKRRGAAEGVDKAQELLRERSSIRRSEIRDDIKKLQKKSSAPQRVTTVV